MPQSEKAKSFLKTIGQTENHKGFSAEERALGILLFHYPKEPWIRFPRKATREEDTLMGIDLVVETVDIGKLFLQIKSSEGAKRRFYQKKRRAMIAVVVVRHADDEDFVWVKLRNALRELRRDVLVMRGDL